MAVLGLKFLERQEEDTIHSQSIECLEKLGVRVHSETVLKILHDAGAKVDFGRETAKIPEKMVNDAIRNAPKAFTLGARDPRQDLKIPVESHPFVSTAGVTVFMTDL